MATGKALDGKPYAGNPHVRFDEGEVASAAKPRRGSLLYNLEVTDMTSNKLVFRAAAAALVAAAALSASAGDRRTEGDSKRTTTRSCTIVE